MSPARAPGRVKARDCLLSSRSHAPGPGGVDAQKNHTAGAGPQREACVSEKGWEGCVSGRVLKKRSAAKVWVRSAGVTSQETRVGVGHTVTTRKTRELFAVTRTLPACIHHIRPPVRDGDHDHQHHADCLHVCARRPHLARPRAGQRLRRPSQRCERCRRLPEQE